MDKTAN